ncbi:membrane progestin receptor gamma-like [Macrobrachium nipponense]|uniref:membrane progestin receptor gamma-like n=1 Tax=Macrobrachium nipponense TaxID=159736 RepID=UPI0030C8A6C5
MFSGYITGRLREAKKLTEGRLKEAGRLMEMSHLPVKRVDEVSETLREPGIITGYRNENCSVLQAMVSLFNYTNETVNFWTHFLAFLYFLWLLVSLATIMPLFEDQYYYPLTCYLFASCAYPLMSCLAHAFSCLSLTALHICYFIDYAAISMYTWSVAVIYFFYSFPVHLMNTWYSQVFLPIAVLNSLLATFCASSSRFFKTPGIQKVLRIVAFVVPFVWDSAPLIIRLYNCDYENDSCAESSIYHIHQFLCVGVAFFFYGSHLPERLAPGCFDYVGHSHNLLHVFSILATNEQMRAIIIDLQLQQDKLENLNWIPTSTWSTIASPLVFLLNILLVLILAYSLFNHRHCCKQPSINCLSQSIIQKSTVQVTTDSVEVKKSK